MNDTARPTASSAASDGPEPDPELLERAHTYDELADALGVDRESARRYARDAVDELVPDETERPPDRVRGEIVDYLLGEQSVLERTLTRSTLEASPVLRDWAAQARLSLSLVLQEALPAIPAGAREERDEDDGAARLGPEPIFDGPPPSLSLDGTHVQRSGRVFGRRTALAVVLGPVAIAAIVIVIAIVSGSSGTRTHVKGKGGAAGSATSRQLSHLSFAPTGAQPHASGAGAIVDARGKPLLLLQGRGLEPNNGTSYAVWLFNNRDDSELLGLVSPKVGSAGTFSSGTALPDDAVRFHEVLVTLEDNSQPVAPGQAILRAPLSLH